MSIHSCIVAQFRAFLNAHRLNALRRLRLKTRKSAPIGAEIQDSLCIRGMST